MAIDGTSGNDALDGTVGDDLINGGDGIDIAVYAGEVNGANGITVTVSTETTAEGDPVILVTDPYGKTDTLVSIEMIVGTENTDTVDLAALAAVGFDGGGGDDSLGGGIGNDSLFGGEGVDTVAGGTGDAARVFRQAA